MLCFDLTVITIIMVNAVILSQSLADNEVVRNEKSFRHRMSLKRWEYKDEKKSRKIKARRPTSYLDPIIIKLDNVIAKYELKKGDLEDFYMGVIGCGLSRCEKFRDLIPENQRLRHLQCFKKQQNGFKKMIFDLLSSFHEGVQRVDKSFQVLINFEKMPHLSNRSRRKVLEEFKVDIKTLNVEIETALLSKRLNFVSEPERTVSAQFQRPENQTHLMIYEWRIIQASKRFLRDWKKNLNKLHKCWKKRRQRRRERMKNDLTYKGGKSQQRRGQQAQ